MSTLTTLTFDCYGTLVQWPERLGALLHANAGRHDPAPPVPEQLLARFRARHHELLTGPYRPYRTMLAEAQRNALADCEIAADEQDERALLAGLRQIPPYDEVPAVLAKLAKRYRIVIVSNSEDALIAGTIAGLGVDPTLVITAERAQAYKPSRRMWEFVLEHVGCPVRELVHVAAGLQTDISPAVEFGVRPVWVNRSGAPQEQRFAQVPSIAKLDELPQLLD